MTILADLERKENARRSATTKLDHSMAGRWELQDAIRDIEATKKASLHSWPAPTALPDGLPPVTAFDYELLPPLVREFVADIAERMQCPPDFVAIAVMVTLASLIGRRCSIAPKREDDWRVNPNLWGMVVSRPGTMKTPALNEAMRPLSVLSERELQAFENSRRDYKVQSLLAEQSAKVARNKITTALKNGKRGEASELAQDAIITEAEVPVCRRYTINDCTVEKLAELLNENPNGLLCFRDELTGFFSNLERQGREADRAFYLECWNGDSAFTYDRIGRGTVHVVGACISMLGGIQPGPLMNIVRKAFGSGDDGLLQRFQLAVWPDMGKDWQNVDRKPNEIAREHMKALTHQLNALSMEKNKLPLTLRFDHDAQLLFDVWRTALELRLRSGNEHPMLEAHLSKYRSLVPSLALIIHLTDHEQGPVELLSLERAIAWAEYLETHACRIYSPAITPDMDAALLLAERIKAGEIAQRFALRDIYRNGWTGLATRDAVLAAVGVLVDFDWLRSFDESTLGRSRTTYEINPALITEAT